MNDKKLKIYKLEDEKTLGENIVEWFLVVFLNSFVLMLASYVFNDFYISSFWYALIASLIILILNKTIKPILVYLTMPVTILTVGIFYPFINVFILKIAGLLLGVNFVCEGLLIPFFVAIFISIMNLIINMLVVKPIVRNKR